MQILSIKRTITFILFGFSVLLNFNVFSQNRKEKVQIIVAPQKSDWKYEKGESAIFQISVLRNNLPLKGIKIKYRIQPESLDPWINKNQFENDFWVKINFDQLNSWEEDSLILDDGFALAKSKVINNPGFIRCHVWVKIDGNIYTSYATAGFSPEEIRPTTILPKDFKEFWQNKLIELSEVSINPIMTLMPERCTEKVNVFHVSFNNITGKIYGVLCVPKASGYYPAILHLPGAGMRSYHGDVENAEKGIITLQIGIHGIPVNLNESFYFDLRSTLFGYWITNMDDKDYYYFKRVYLGCIRAVDFIETLDNFNGTIAVTGESQGGGLSLITAGLDERIDFLAIFYPGLCDLTGYLKGSTGGWPHLFLDSFTNQPQKIETSKYFDAVNFARYIKAPGWYSWGFNDNVCPPTSMFAAYNIIQAPKELQLFEVTQHWTFREQQELKNNWLEKKLLGKHQNN